MAQDDNDFIGFLMKTFFKLVGWIFLGIFKLLWIIVSAIFKGIASLFRKGETQEEVSAEKETTND